MDQLEVRRCGLQEAADHRVIKIPVLVSKIFGTGKKYRYRYGLTFWVQSHTDQQQSGMDQLEVRRSGLQEAADH